MSSSTISVQVEPRFLPEQSSPGDHLYTFAYTITVYNTGKVSAQLISRHWQIEDASGHKQEVQGLGVIGQQPLIPPGESFRYTSGCRLQAGTGSMKGSFFFVTETGERFDVDIAAVEFDANASDASTVRVLH